MTRIEFIKKKNLLELDNTLPKEFFDKNKKKYLFKWIVNCNLRETILLRNRDKVISTSKTQQKIKLADHTVFIQNYQNIPRIDFMIMDEDKSLMVGGTSILLSEFGLEIGKYIGREEYLGCGIAKAATASLLFFFDKEFYGFELYSKTRKDNFINISINEKLGFAKDRELKDGFILMKRS
jgi:RimJ/RimL family protein N-acetyltransferase